jgi:hypothetical protein
VTVKNTKPSLLEISNGWQKTCDTRSPETPCSKEERIAIEIIPNIARLADITTAMLTNPTPAPKVGVYQAEEM